MPQQHRKGVEPLTAPHFSAGARPAHFETGRCAAFLSDAGIVEEPLAWACLRQEQTRTPRPEEPA
jgi:hypothetical protein